MLKNYFTVAFRNLTKNRIYSFINVSGLSVGIACFILLFLFIRDEISYDRFHKNGNNIYRVVTHASISGSKYDIPFMPSPAGKAMTNEIPEVIDFTRIRDRDKLMVKVGDQKFYESNIFITDTSFFKIFTYSFIEGGATKALIEPNTIVLTESLAKKCFGKDKALNKTVQLENEHNYKVTGVIQDPPKNAHFHFTAVTSYQTIVNQKWWGIDQWDNFNDYLYVHVKEGTDIKLLNKKIEKIFKKYAVDFIKNTGVKAYFDVQSLFEIHLHSKLNFELEPNGDINYIYICTSVALLILIIACINYMNLATARSSNRAREVGVRKVVGSYRLDLIYQFITESFVITFLALLIAILVTYLLLPFLNTVTGKALTLNFLHQPYLLLILAGVLVFVGLLGGSYPAFFLSAFKPIEVLKGKLSLGAGNVLLRKGLVVFQFSVSIILIIGTFIIYEQLQFVNSKNLGFTKDQVLVVELKDTTVNHHLNSFKSALLKFPSIKKVSLSNSGPGLNNESHNGFKAKINGETRNYVLLTLSVDEEYFDLMDIQLKEGRNFDRSVTTDEEQAVIINESCAKHFGVKNPIGMQIGSPNDSVWKFKVVGVIKDFHIRSLHEPIRPMLLRYSKKDGQYILAKVSQQNIDQTIKHTKEVYNSFSPPSPFEYFFLDQNFRKQYDEDEKKGIIFLSFSTLTILIALLGLFGLASYTTEKRTKEIGIRKVLGASMRNIITIISKEFIILIAISSIIAWPLAFYFMKEWLADFQYRIELSPISFIAATLLTFLISFFTLLFQAVKAATINPVKTLKAE